MKRAALIIIVALVLAGAAFYFFSRAYPQKVRAVFVPEIEHVRKAEVRLMRDTAYAELLLELANRGLFRMNIDSISYTVEFDTLRVINESRVLGIRLSVGQRDTLHFPVRFPYKRVLRRAASLEGNDSVAVATFVRIAYNTVFGRKRLERRETVRVAVPVPPRFELVKWQFRGFSKGAILLSARIRMENKGALELRLRNISATFNAEGIFTATGTYPDTVYVKPRSTLSHDFAVSVRPDKPLQLIRSLLEKEQPYSVRVTGEFLPEGEKEPTKIELVTGGSAKMAELFSPPDTE